MNLIDRILRRLALLLAVEQGDKDTQAFLLSLTLQPLTGAQRLMLADYTLQHGELQAARLAADVRAVEQRLGRPVSSLA